MHWGNTWKRQIDTTKNLWDLIPMQHKKTTEHLTVDQKIACWHIWKHTAMTHNRWNKRGMENTPKLSHNQPGQHTTHNFSAKCEDTREVYLYLLYLCTRKHWLQLKPQIPLPTWESRWEKETPMQFQTTIKLGCPSKADGWSDIYVMSIRRWGKLLLFYKQESPQFLNQNNAERARHVESYRIILLKQLSCLIPKRKPNQKQSIWAKLATRTKLP